MPYATMIRVLTVFYCLLSLSLSAEDTKGFSFKDTDGKYLDVLLDGKIAARYMYEHDTSTPEQILVTYKPYLHIFNSEGTEPITKGPGGTFPHHRAIFIGWNIVTFAGKKYDLWHMKGTQIIHQKFLEQKAGEEGTVTALIHWIVEKDKAILEEERTFKFRRAPAGRFTVDFSSKIKAALGDVDLNGDPEHAGIHYRPAAEVTTKETVYVFPKENADATKDLDFPWVGESYTLKGKRHSVVEMSHPENPKGTRWSAYRDYGRFGEFPKKALKSGETFTFKYRFLLADGEMPATDAIQKSWDEFAGVAQPTPLPKVTIKPAAQPKPAAPKDDKKPEKEKTEETK
jgi:hypothetical protein